MTLTLYCVGCGAVAALAWPGDVLAISCKCGAYSPLLAEALDDPFGKLWSMPASLMRIISGEVSAEARPHVENYLGYSGGTNPAKRFWENQLRAYGLTSAADCEREECRERYAQMAAR